MKKEQITQKAFIESLNEIDEISEFGNNEKYQANDDTTASETCFSTINEAKNFWRENEILSRF